MRELAHDFGLDFLPPFHRDRIFFISLLAGIIFWTILLLYFPSLTWSLEHVPSWGFFSLVIWQPFLEELFFRGIIQGQLFRFRWGSYSFFGISVANGVTTFLFAFAHWMYQSSPWIFGVIIPSLLFGFFRDRYANIYPSFALHAYYNGGFFLLMGPLR